MASKRDIADEVEQMRAQLSRDEPARDAAEGGESEAGRAFGEQTREQWRNFAEAQGDAAEELKGVWDQLRGELRDMPAKKPLVTAGVAFLIGFSLGRMGRR